MIDINQNKSFCPLPWINISVDPDGSVKPCCVSTDFITTEDGSNFNLGKHRLEEILNSPNFVSLRQKMISGEIISGCNECYKQEKFNGKSLRINHFNHWKDNDIFKEKLKSTTITNSVEYLDLRFGNLCNLSCKSCTPRNSSTLAKEMQEIALSDNKMMKYMPIEDFSKINDWYQTEVFFDNIQGQLQHIQILYITGGEPSIIQKNYEILELLVSKNFNQNIILIINTNLTNLKNEFINLIAQFKHVILYVSIDGVEKIQEYLRYPSKWKAIDENFKKLVSLNKDNITILPSPVVQNVNLEFLVDLFDYFENFNKVANKKIVIIKPIMLYNPEWMDLLYLPYEYKIQCYKNIKNWYDNKCEYQKTDLADFMVELQEKCFRDVDYTEKLKKFKEFTEIFDNHRNLKLSDINYNISTFI